MGKERLDHCVLDPNSSFLSVTCSRGYLLFYNGVQFLYWFWITLTILTRLWSDKDFLMSIFRTFNRELWFLQGIVFLDIFNVLTGLVKTRDKVGLWLLIHCKVLRRMTIMLLLVYFSPQAQEHWSVGLMILYWSVLDSIRYSFYALKSIEYCPKWLTFLRYSQDVVLYPLGLFVELIVKGNIITGESFLIYSWR
eukprot:TRINITY_DN1648_c0_g1_i9.p1 TRINITY_DN1648_c0_g1~~TRINITY_DN1648_c0_g1_i9.p1  ORF type:complete len:194 (+),score=14.00 TRINITY_DN1648_c0_g1_i9:172-753(+)